MSSESTTFLYPFLEEQENDADGLLADLARSAQAKMEESRALCTHSLARWETVLGEAGAAMADRFVAGGRLLAFGNGGSATDAEGMVQLFGDAATGRALPALSLVDDPAVLTALSNDVGFALVFSRQIIAHAHPDDIAVGFSTSGDSVNLLRGFEEAAKRGLLTIGLCGYEGSAMALSHAVAHCLVVGSESVHRIQEAQAALSWRLWSIVQRHLSRKGMA